MYHLELENEEPDIASHCSHNPFEEIVVISERTPIDKEFKLECNWSDFDVYLEAPDTVHSCLDFQKSVNIGPHQTARCTGSSRTFNKNIACQLA